MNIFEQNISFNLGIGTNQLSFTNDFNYGIIIDEGEHITFAKLLNFSHELQYTIASIWWVSLVIGSFFRYILYSYYYQQYKEKSVKTIDRLLVVIALVEHLTIGQITIDVTLKVINIRLLNESSGFSYAACRFRRYYGRFAESYAFIGSLGLAAYRHLYIRMGHFVKDVVGEKTMANLILFIGLGSSALIMFYPQLLKQDWGHLEWEHCLNPPQIKHVSELLEDYEQSLGRSPSLPSIKYTYLGERLTYLLLTLTEICLYVSFFHYMYKHDNCQKLKRLLEPAIIHQRNKTNAISFFGQFCSFVLEFIRNVFFLVALVNAAPKNENEQIDMFAFAYCSIPVTFAAISFIEVILSNVLRAKMMKF